MEFASKREFKKFTEAFTAFLARRETREIRRQAKNVDPNAGFRLINSNTALAARMRESAERMAMKREAKSRSKPQPRGSRSAAQQPTELEPA